MKVKVVKIKENKDGSADVTVEYDKEFEKMAITTFIRNALEYGVKNARSKKNKKNS